MIEVGRIGSSSSEGNLCGGRASLVVCLAIGKQQVRKFCLSSFTSTDTNLYVCASRDYNKALPRGLIAEDRTQQLLEIAIAERDYRVTLSEENLWASHLWSSVEVENCIIVPPLELILPLLCLRHAMHVVFGGNNL